MKAQISFVEYLVALSIFITFVGYIFFSLLNFMPTYLGEMEDEIIKSEAYQISEMLINDPGEPVSWNTLIGTGSENQIKRIGFSDSTAGKTNFLSATKITSLVSKCPVDGYGDDIKNWIDTKYQFSLIVDDKTGGVLLDCHPPQTVSGKVKASIRRVVAIGSGYGELVLQVW